MNTHRTIAGFVSACAASTVTLAVADGSWIVGLLAIGWAALAVNALFSDDSSALACVTAHLAAAIVWFRVMLDAEYAPWAVIGAVAWAIHVYTAVNTAGAAMKAARS